MELKKIYQNYLEQFEKMSKTKEDAINAFRVFLIAVSESAKSNSKASIAKELEIETKKGIVKVSEKTIGTWTTSGQVLSEYTDAEWVEFGSLEIEATFGDIWGMVKSVEMAGLARVRDIVESADETAKALNTISKEAKAKVKAKRKARPASPEKPEAEVKSEARFSKDEVQKWVDYITESPDLENVGYVIERLSNAIKLRKQSLALEGTITRHPAGKQLANA